MVLPCCMEKDIEAAMKLELQECRARSPERAEICGLFAEQPLHIR
jgi:hypothetical protein